MVTIDDNDYLQRVNDFYSVLKAKLQNYRDAKQRLDPFFSTDFNVFNLFDPNENRLSEIIADLLDPSGSHGQQHKFLDAFLQIIERPELKDQELLKVDNQVQTDHNSENPKRLIDIVVEFENFGIGIENKKRDGGDQPGQLRDYYCHLEKKYGKDKCCLVYLTPDGDDPSEASIKRNLKERLESQRRLVCTSCTKWIEECCPLCESDKFRWFLRDFKDHLNGGQTMAMRNKGEMILDHALESKENLETALDIGFTFDDLRKRLIVDFLDKLKIYVLDELGDHDESQWHVNDDTFYRFPLKNDSYYSFGKKSWGASYGVGLQLHKNTALIGAWRPEGAPNIESLKQTLDKKIKSGGQDKWYEWYYYLEDPYRNWGAADGLIRLKFPNGKAVKHIGQELAQVIKVAAPIIDRHVKNLGKKRS